MALDPPNSSNLEQLALKGRAETDSIRAVPRSLINTVVLAGFNVPLDTLWVIL